VSDNFAEIIKRTLVIILILDTSTKKMSLALLDIESQAILATYQEETEENSHAKKINLAIIQLLEQTAHKFTDLSAVAINEGPGSFTGLRVGSSTAKGICFALNIPMIAISGLVAYGNYLYSEKPDDVTDVFILIDARRSNYFYTHISEYGQEATPAFNSLANIENEAKECQHPRIYYIDKMDIVQLSAEKLKQAVLEKWKSQDFVHLTSFEPMYLINNYLVKK
jgi:tRNA threonylcarbamoyladenosine biosynthesis protein TsaB